MRIFLASLIVATALAQPKFEVASVKRADRCFTGNSSLDPGSVTLKGLPLRAVLMEAFKVKMEQIEGPTWLDTDCYEIAAKYPEGIGKDQLPAMLQALMEERFKLTTRKENRPTSGFVLVVDKGGPKFKEDDPKTNFMGEGAKPGLMLFGAFGHGALKGVMTMTTLASNLSRQGYGPVEDQTGLTGRYDIALFWTPDRAFEPGAGDALPGADIPAPGPTLFTALRELGLRMERRTVQVPFVVVEHIERTPTGN